MAPPSKQEAISSPLVSALNNIVNTKRSGFQMRSTKNSYDDFLRFMQVEVKNIEAIRLPREKKIAKLANINVASTFGRPGSLLSSLASGAMDVAGFLGNMFGGRKPGGKPSKPIPKNKGFRIGGVKALGIANAAFAGLDFATGLAEGESVGKAAAGAGGALAGSLIGGAIGQALIPIPGLGLVVGSMAGNFLGGYLGDRAHEAATGTNNVKEKQEQKLAQLEAQQKESAAASISKKTFPGVLDKFDTVVYEFEVAAARGLFGPTSGRSGSLDGKDQEDEESYHEEIEPREGGGKAPSDIQNNTYSVTGGELPSKYVNTKDYNEFRSYYNGGKGGYHAGEDLPIDQGTPVSLIVPGTVERASFTGGGAGGEILITHEDGTQTRYLHMSEITVSVGQKVSSGVMIGKTGGTPGTTGAGRSTGPHLHFEYYPSTTAAMADPNPVMDNYFRFGGNIQVKKKVSAQSGVMGQNGRPTAVLMAGTNDYGDPTKGAAGVRQAIKNLQDKGFNVVVVPPSEVGQTAEVSKQVQEVAKQMGATVRKGQYKPTDDSGAIGYAHLTKDSADAIARDYKGATFVGDSNAQMIPGAKIAAPSKSASTIASMINEQISSAGPAVQPAPPQPQVQATPQQPVQPQEVQQYPSYSMPTQNVTVVPMMMGSPGGGSQQKPVVISSSDGSSATIMPSVSKNQMLNSLFTTALLTNLSGT